MTKTLIVYHSRTGNTKRMAEEIEKAIANEGEEVVSKAVDIVKVEELLAYDAIIIGSPVYYGSMSAEIKGLLDESVRFHRQLDGKIGAAFASSANIGGGNETAIMDIIKAMLIHGMVVQGDPKGDHYGPVAIGSPDSRSLEQCRRLGKRIVELLRKI